MSAPKINFSQINSFETVHPSSRMCSDTDSQKCARENYSRTLEITQDNVHTKDILDSIFKRENQEFQHEKRLSEYRNKILGEIKSYMKTHSVAGQVVEGRGGNSTGYHKSSQYRGREGCQSGSEDMRGDNSYYSLVNTDTDGCSMNEFFISSACDYKRSPQQNHRSSVTMTTHGSPLMSVEELLTCNEDIGRDKSIPYEAMMVDKRSEEEAVGLLQQNDFLMSIQEAGDASNVQTGTYNI